MWDVKFVLKQYFFQNITSFTLTMWDVKEWMSDFEALKQDSFTLTMWDVKIYDSFEWLSSCRVLP